MPQRLRTSSAIAAALFVLAFGFQNCAQDLPSEATAPSSAFAPASLNSAVFKPKLRIASAKQTADISSLGTNWKTIPGTTVAFNLKEKLTAEFRANGSATVTGGVSYAATHCGIRFLVDGVPYGNPTWGDVIVHVVSHTPWTATRELDLEAGDHTVSVQMTGWPGADSTCVISAQDYGATRFYVEGF